jgi:hypothetical protein
MKYLDRYVIGLSLAGSALGAPVWAQDTLSSPEVRFEIEVLQLPDVHVQTDIESCPEVVITQARRAARAAASDLQEAQEVQARALRQFSTNQVYQNMATMYTPEMAKKTRDIALLRQMLSLKLTARDIEKAIPLLKEVKESDKIVPAKPEQAMDEEYRKLLEAKPGDPMPPSSADVFRDAAGNFRTRKQAVWEKMAQQIGRDKMNGIRGMLRSEGTTFFSNGTAFQNLISKPGTFTIPGPTDVQPPRRGPERAPRAKPAPAPGEAPATADAPVTINPVDGDDSPAVVSPRPAKPGDLAAGVVRVARPRATQPGAEPASPQEPATADSAESARRKERAEQRAARAQGGTTAPPTTYYLSPGARGLTLDSGGNRMRFAWTAYNQVSVDELIDLFERKLAAMRR